MTDNIPSSLQINVVGCGQCGSRIAAYFDKMPSFIKHRPWHLYPVRCAAIDTDSSIENSLPKPPWNWRDLKDIHILPPPSPEIVLSRITGKTTGDSSGSMYNVATGAYIAGAGGFPFIGTITAEEYLLKKSNVGDDLQKRLIDRGFTQGTLLIANSLTGGTGTGFAPVIPEFFAPFHNSRIILDLAIVPQMTSPQQRAQIYPKNILYGLYKLSQSKRVDAVILADNDILSYFYNCKGNQQYNSLLHDMLSPILLAPIGEYGYPNFRKDIDFADIGRTLRPHRGMAEAELCALAYAKKKMPSKFRLSLMSKRRRYQYIQDWLSKLIDAAIFRTTIGKINNKNDIKGAVGILSGPPEFFDIMMEGNEAYYNNLVNDANMKITPNLQLGCLKFPDCTYVQLSLILSGISSQKLEDLYRENVPEKEQTFEGTFMDRIRRMNPKTAEDLMVKEIKEKLQADARK